MIMNLGLKLLQPIKLNMVSELDLKDKLSLGKSLSPSLDKKIMVF